MGTVELAITSILGVIMTCVAVDLGVMMYGNQVLDRAARDAARAAAGQTGAATAKEAAKAALASHQTDGLIIKQPVLKEDEFVYQDYGGAPFGRPDPNTGVAAGNPYVNVTVTSQVVLPANVSFFNGALDLKKSDPGNNNPLATGYMNFRRTYHFPIVKVPLDTNYGGND
jgi:Flp pilus assembly protein TadG